MKKDKQTLILIHTMKNAVTMVASTSATTTAYQIPSSPQIKGRVRTAAHWNTMVRKRAISAEVSPSPSAVNREEPKMAKPDTKKEKEKIVKACTVIAMSSTS